MRFGAEATDDANNGLNIARELLEPLQAKYNVSHGDLWTLAGCVAIEACGGPKIDWQPGRQDKDESACPPNGRLPDATQGVDHVREVFARMGMDTDREMVALSGCHTLGRCHAERSGFEGPWTHAPLKFDNEVLFSFVWRWFLLF